MTYVTHEVDPCPHCHADLNGELIWQHYFDAFGDAERADAVAEQFGATRTDGYFRNTMTMTGVQPSRTFCGVCKGMLP